MEFELLLGLWLLLGVCAPVARRITFACFAVFGGFSGYLAFFGSRLVQLPRQGANEPLDHTCRQSRGLGGCCAGGGQVGEKAQVVPLGPG